MSYETKSKCNVVKTSSALINFILKNRSSFSANDGILFELIFKTTSIKLQYLNSPRKKIEKNIHLEKHLFSNETWLWNNLAWRQNAQELIWYVM